MLLKTFKKLQLEGYNSRPGLDSVIRKKVNRSARSRDRFKRLRTNSVIKLLLIIFFQVQYNKKRPVQLLDYLNIVKL